MSTRTFPALVSGSLADGTPVVARPIRHDDGIALRSGLARLSPASQVLRFLHYRRDFSEEELHYLTHCDMQNHVAMMLSVLGPGGGEIDRIGVARYVRDEEKPAQAEVAIVVVDEWQNLGGGKLLLGALAAASWQGGIRHWQAFTLAENPAIQPLLRGVGTETGARLLGNGMLELRYDLRAPQAQNYSSSG